MSGRPPVRRRLPAPALLALTAAIGLAACSSDKQTQVCPRLAVLSEAGTLTRFRPGAGRDILDIDYQAQVGDLVATCEYPDVKGKRQVLVQVAPVFVLSRGPANTDRKAAFTYFVSVVRNGEILSKQPYDIAGEFAENRSRLVVTDDDPPIIVDIPLTYRAAEYEYEILVGIQLTPVELEYNQRSPIVGR